MLMNLRDLGLLLQSLLLKLLVILLVVYIQIVSFFSSTITSFLILITVANHLK